MNIRKEWLGFALSLLVLFFLSTVLLLFSRKNFHLQAIESQDNLIRTELTTLVEENEYKLLERDITFLDLGVPEMAYNQEELLEYIALDVLTLPRVNQVHAYDTAGKPIPLATGTMSNPVAKRFSLTEKNTPAFFYHNQGDSFSLFFRITTFEGTYIFEILLEEDFILNEWEKIDGQLLEQGFLIILAGILILYVIFHFMTKHIQERERKLEQQNTLLRKTNQKLAQAYKTVSLGALTGHLMHSLKTPLTSLQILASEADKNNNIDPKELADVHGQIKDLVSQSLHSLQEIENQNQAYEMRIAEIFKLVIDRTSSISKLGNVIIKDSSNDELTLDNLRSSLLSPIIISLLENAFQSRKDTEVSLQAEKDNHSLLIHVKDTSTGIPASEQDFLFDPTKSRKKDGTGLGLALAQQLARSMGAKIKLIHSDNGGSHFTIFLNIEPNQVESVY
jgi:signal transduction histidine kinase